MKRASYRDGIWWLAHNDDIDWLHDLDAGDTNASPSVTACLLADLFGVTTERVTADLRRQVAKDAKQERGDLVIGQCPECFAINAHEASCSRRK